MSQSQREHASTYAWFFTELINKSVIEYLSTWDRFVLPRKLRLSDGFMENVNLMCEILLNEIVERASKNLTQADSINTALAYFISDAFATMDRTFLINQIRRFNKTMVDKIWSVS
jgi:predicted nucleic acid-binding protein